MKPMRPSARGGFFGAVTGNGPIDDVNKLLVKACSAGHEAFYVPSQGFDDLVERLCFRILTPNELQYVLDGSKKLDTLIVRRCQMRVELDVQKTICPMYGYPNPNMIPCWQGKIVSNVLQLPN